MTDLLTKLHLAGVANHGVEIDPPPGIAERRVLDALMTAVEGTVFRLRPFAYAVRVREGEDVAVLLRRALDGLVPPEAISVVRTDPAPAPAEPVATRSLTLIGALAAGADTVAAEETPAQRAVLDAGFAVAAARLAAEGSMSLDANPRAERAEHALERIEARLRELERPAGHDVSPAVVERLDALSARLDAIADRLAAPPEPGMPEAIEARLSGIEHRLEALVAALPGSASPDHRQSFLRFSVALQAVLRRIDGKASALAEAVRRVEAAVPVSGAAPPGGGDLESGLSRLSEELGQVVGAIRADNACTRSALAEFMARADRAGLSGAVGA